MIPSPSPSQAPDLRQLLEQIAARMSEFMDVERSTIFLLDPEKDELWTPVAQGLGGTDEIRVRRDQGIAGAVMESGQPLRIDDPYNDPRFYPEVDRRTGFRTRNLFCRPLQAPDGRRIGVIQLLNKRGGPLNEREERLLDILCSQAAIAIENAQLYLSLKRASDSEHALLAELSEKHTALRDAFLDIERASNQRSLLEQRLRKLRIGALLAVTLLFSTLGYFVWRGVDRPRPAATTRAGTAMNVVWHTVETAPVTASVSLLGHIEPLEVRNISSPFRGRVAERNFQYGELVTQGQLLARIDPTELQVELRTASVAAIKARNELARLQNWRTGPEVARAERALLKARLSYEAHQRNLREMEQLSALGIIAASSLESARQRSVTEESDYKAAQEDHANVLAGANEERITIAGYDVENTRLRVTELETKLAQAEIRAPLSGIVILPNTRPQTEEGHDGFYEVGMTIEQGSILLSLGNLEGVAVRTRADEVDVARVRHGQRVLLTGEAFQDTQLDAVVNYVSSQAILTGGRAYFEIGVKTTGLTASQRATVRLGMTARLEIIVYNAPTALVVPVSAVGSDGTGRFVWRRSGAGEPQRVTVQTGVVIPTGVEVLAGLNAGDRVAAEVRALTP